MSFVHSRRRPFVPRLTALEDRTLPSTFTVLNLNDSGLGSLRAAVAAANANPNADTIRFAPLLSGTIRLTSGPLTLSNDVTIDGPGAHRIAVSGNDASRVFQVTGAGTDAVIEGLTITHGRAGASAATLPSTGGGILNHGNLTLTDVVLSRNRAIGDARVVVPISAVLNMAGAGVGGGIASFGTLSVTRTTFTANEALGADDADSSAFSFPARSFPGTAFGGAFGNFGTTTISASTFTDNLALAGNRGRGDFAAIASGGAILNDATLTISGSIFRHNQAIAGNEAVSPFHNGHALGGSILSGSLLPIVGGRSGALTVLTSTFEHNQAIGGNDNRVTLPLDQVPPADAPNNAYGGGITVFQGTGVIRHTVVRHNQAIAGIGGGDQKGSLGVGGGVFFFSFLGGVTGTLEGSVITHNEAIGGEGRNGGRGGDGQGGGLAAGSLGSPFGAPGTVAVSATLVSHNRASGGDGGRGGDGGDGLGGGVYNGAGSTLTATASAIIHNEARGGRGRSGGSDGLGIGGGVYNLGTFTDQHTLIAHNRSSSQTVPFRVNGGGTVPLGLPVFPGGTGPHNATGNGTYLGRYTGNEGLFELLSFNPATGTGTFRGSFVFVAANGDRLAMNYGANPANPGRFTLTPVGGGKVVARFVAEFTPDPARSTGRFAHVTGGSFIMVATSEPFDPTPNPQGFTAPFAYTWVGEGTLEFDRRRR